jgi:hypothetical protein
MSEREARQGERKARRKLRVELVPLTWGERLDIIDALSMVLGDVYAHLPLKRALYGFDIVRGLEHVRQQVATLSDLQFHRELTTLVNRLRDAHTQYRGPWRKNSPVASLPFLVEAYGPASAPTYVVSKVDRRAVRDPHFVVGITIEYWNGIPFDRAVDIHAERETGGRPDARRARALESLTFRSLDYAPPPDEEWVVLGYRGADGRSREIRLDWEGIDPKNVAAAGRGMGSRIRRGINPAAEAVRRAKKFRFSRPQWNAELRADAPRATHKLRSAGAAAYDDFLTAKRRTTKQGDVGYLRIWSFDVEDDQAFIDAVIAKLRDLPDDGLIIDLRDNPGGFIWAAERLLQLFTPNRITPTKFALRATPLTLAMAKAPFNQEELARWADSLERAAQTGEPYSSHLPITPPEACNDIGQHYNGPVLVVVDANTYSSGDLFTAGFLDNRIGPVVCIGEATGAGGANVWYSSDLGPALRAAKSPLPTLPDYVDFNVALRRAVRSNDADGTLIEDAGIPGEPYEMTQDDIFRRNRDLIEHCAELLAERRGSTMKVSRRGATLTVETTGIDRLDMFVDGHPGGPSRFVGGDGRQRFAIPDDAAEVELVGCSNGSVCQRRRMPIIRRA